MVQKVIQDKKELQVLNGSDGKDGAKGDTGLKGEVGPKGVVGLSNEK